MMEGLISPWLAWALASTLFYGINAFLLHRLINQQGDTLTALVISPAVVTLIAAVMLSFSAIPEIDGSFWLLALFALLQGGLFFLTIESRASAMALGLPSTILYPIIKSGTLFVIVISAFLFDELQLLLEPRRLTGILLITLSVVLLLQWSKKILSGGSSRGIALAFALLATFTSIGATLAPKYVIEFQPEMNIFVFILISNLFTTLLSSIRFNYRTEMPVPEARKAGAISGIWLGITSFAGFAAFLKAIHLGPLSIVAAVSSLYILIPIVLSVILFKEPLRARSQVALFLSLLGIVLCK